MGRTRLTVMNNGSLRVEGDDFEIVDQDGRAFGLHGRQKVSLCRCGQSSNKPFCDGTHKSCGFASTLVAFDMPPPKPPAAPGAAPAVAPQPGTHAPPGAAGPAEAPSSTPDPRPGS